jgi:hypothetical protein
MNNNGTPERRRSFILVKPPRSKKALRPSHLPFSRSLLPSAEALLVLSGLVGAALNAVGSWWGFAVWLPGNIGLAILNHKRGQKWQAALFAAYTLTAAYGITTAWIKVKG